MFQTTVNKLMRVFRGKEELKDEREFFDGVHNLQQALDFNTRFGFCKAKRKYIIGIIFDNNRLRFVTDVDYSTKEFRYEWDKQAKFFTDSYYLEDLVCAMNVNGYAAFIMTVPDFFHDESFKNPKEDKAYKENE